MKRLKKHRLQTRLRQTRLRPVWKAEACLAHMLLSEAYGAHFALKPGAFQDKSVRPAKDSLVSTFAEFIMPRLRGASEDGCGSSHEEKQIIYRGLVARFNLG
jgi:hypothetical protein